MSKPHPPDSCSSSHNEVNVAEYNKPSIWHGRLAHCSQSFVRSLVANGLLDKSSLSSVSESSMCSSCHLCKSHALPFQSINKRASRIFDTIYSDVWGPAPIPSSSGSRYYVIFIDSYSRHTWIHFMKHKSEVFRLFTQFQALVRNKYSSNIVHFQCDGGGEFISNEFTEYLLDNGITRQISCSHTPQQNGIAERKHRHIVESALSMMHDTDLPMTLWTEAFHTAVINRLPLALLDGKSLYFLLHQEQPRYEELRVFGCVCYVHVDVSLRNKFQDRAILCRFIAYAENYKG
uniref:Integrase catalytic domain-containing protein n=1 Tax=Nymphaea colorata TaxID=210225 RepID=A0A5K1EPL3_9MAGN|nr:unnamed protein product [Nymphaea colorata]